LFNAAGLPALFLLVTLATAGCRPPPRALSLGVPLSAQASLVWLALDLGYFDAEGLRVAARPFPSGKRALEALLRDEIELAVSAETPFAIAAFDHPELRLFATIGGSDNDMRVLARRDHGIDHIEDLAGKTLATQSASAVHFFLRGFLLFHGLDGRLPPLRFLKIEALPSALTRGDVDAIAAREPFLSQARAAIDARRRIEFALPGLYTKTHNLVGREGYREAHPDTIERLLRALDRARRYARARPERAITRLARRLSLPREALARLWPSLRLRLSLDQGLLTTLREEAQWAIDDRLVPDHEAPPDFLGFLDPQPLRHALPNDFGLLGLMEE